MLPDTFRRWLRLPSSRAQLERDVEDEIAFHLAMREDKLRAAGLSADDARQRARERFGNPGAVAASLHEIDLGTARADRRAELGASVWQDARYAVRALRRTPAFTVASLVTLALGIGATTGVFSVVYGVLLRPLPYADPERLVQLWETSERAPGDRNPVSVPNYADWVRHTRAFSGMAAYAYNRYTLTGEGPPESVQGAQLFGDAFGVLGVRPLVGRGIALRDARQDVVVLSEGLWRRRYGANPRLIGGSIRLNGEPYAVVGIMPAEFRFPRPDVELWTGYRTILTDPAWGEARGRRFQRVIARMWPGVTLVAANADVDAVARRLAEQYPDDNGGGGATAVPLQEQLVGESRTALLVLFGAVACVLLIGCANVAHLLLARTAARERELAVRAALGAGRGRLVRQLLTESLVLAAAGGVMGVGVAYASVWALRAFNPAAVPRVEEVRVDGSALLFTAIAVIVAALLVGLAPALRATRRSLAESVRDGGRGTGVGVRQRATQGLLVSAEVGMSLVLLVGAAVLIRSFERLQSVDAGIDESGVVSMLVVAPPARYPGAERQNVFFEQLIARLSALPGVRAVGMCDCLPPDDVRSNSSLFIEGGTRDVRDLPIVNQIQVGASYFAAVRVPVLAGRAFTPADRAGAAPVATVNRTLATRVFQVRDLREALGRRVSFDGTNWLTVVGVVGDVHYEGLARPVAPALYSAFAQNPVPFANVLIRVAGDPMAILPVARRTIADVDPDIAPSRVATLEDAIADSIAGERFNTIVLGAFAGLAFLLAAVGIYGVVAYGVAQRRQEMGVRIALGARGTDVVRLVVGRSLRPVLAGVVIGLAVAWMSARVLEGMVYGTSVRDPLVYGAVAGSLVVVAVLAAWMPGRRAARADPMTVLRAE